EGGDPLDGQKFDLIVCASAYHHLGDIKSATKTLTTYLKPGSGHLIVLDLQLNPGHSHRFHNSEHSHHDSEHSHHNPEHSHHNPEHAHKSHIPASGAVNYPGGFSHDQIREAFEGNGGLLENVIVRTAFSFKKMTNEGVELEFEYLLAKGRRPKLVE
ncbi:12893_t:CDS:2, partial [Ambispora leptoticha]